MMLELNLRLLQLNLILGTDEGAFLSNGFLHVCRLALTRLSCNLWRQAHLLRIILALKLIVFGQLWIRRLRHAVRPIIIDHFKTDLK